MLDLKPVPRTGGRGTFFCSAKRKYPKKRRPDAAYTLRSSLSTGVARRAIHGPSGNAMHPCIVPNGLIPPKAPVLGAA